MINPAPYTSGPIARDASALILQARSGNALNIELTGHAWDVVQDLGRIFQPQPALYDDLAPWVESYAREEGSSNLTFYGLVTDHIPEQIKQCERPAVRIYNGIQDSGTSFSSADVRLTNTGTVMTSVNITDLAAYFRSGRGYQLLTVIDTHRDQELNALDQMLTELPAMLQASGMKPEQVADVIAAIKAGNISPAVMKVLTIAAEIARLKSTPGLMPAQTATRIQALARDFGQMLTNPRILRGLKPALTRALVVIAPTIQRVGANPLSRLSMTIRPNNDNRALGLKPMETLRNMVRSAPAMGKLIAPLVALGSMAFMSSTPARTAEPTIQNTARTSAEPFATPVIRAVESAPTVLTPTVTVVATAPSHQPDPAPAIVAAIPTQAAPVSVETAKAPDPVTTAPANTQPVSDIIQPAQPQAEIAKPMDIAPPVTAPSTNAPAQDAALPPTLPPSVTPDALPPTQTNPDMVTKPNGQLADCCRDKFAAVANPDKLTTKKDVELILGRDVANAVTVGEAREYLRSVKRAEELTAQSGLASINTADKNYQDETARLIADIKKPSGGNHHVHDAFCNCAAHATQPSPAVSEAQKHMETLRATDAALLAKSFKFEP